MKIKDFTPTIGYSIKINLLNCSYHLQGCIDQIEDKYFRLQDNGFTWSIDRTDEIHEIIEIYDDQKNLIYCFADEKIKEKNIATMLKYDSKEAVLERKAISEKEGTITKEDIRNLLLDIEIYNGLCNKKEKDHE